MSSNSRSIPNIIPHEICSALLPGPGLSVSQFMNFLLPNISPNLVTNSVNITNYLSESTPDLKLDQKLLRDLPLPGRAVLKKKNRHLGHLADFCQQKYPCVQYAHLPQSSQLTKLPVWVFVYWVEVFFLRKHVHEPWTKAEERQRNGSGPRETDFRLVQRGICAINSLRNCWHFCGHGFSDDSPTAKLTTYLLRQWLGTVHMDQQFDMLWWDGIRSIADAKCEIMDTGFFIKLCQVYRKQLQKPYHAQTPGAQQLWWVGKELAAGIPLHHKAQHKCTCRWPRSVPVGTSNSKCYTWICVAFSHQVTWSCKSTTHGFSSTCGSTGTWKYLQTLRILNTNICGTKQFWDMVSHCDGTKYGSISHVLLPSIQPIQSFFTYNMCK